MRLAATYLAWASAVAVPIGVAPAQILLGMACVALLVSRTPLRLPRIWIPLAAFLGLTVVSLALSADPAQGLPQIRKLYVYLALVAVFSAFRTPIHAARLVAGWTATGALSSIVGLVQFANRVREVHRSHQDFYEGYIGWRIKGFASNWQTFSGEILIVLVTLAALLLFWPRLRKRDLAPCAAAAVVIAAALLLAQTRGAWLAAIVAGLYLLWSRKRVLLLAVPPAFALLMWANPASVRTRFMSMVAPQDADSNQHRVVCWRTGWEMIRAHPWFGLGPEMVGKKFMEYVPPDIPRPLPTGWYGHLHNIYIHYAAERGVPAALALVAFLVLALRDFLRALRKLPRGPGELQAVLHGAVAVTLGVMVAGAFELNLGDSEVLAMFLAALACGYVAVSVVEARETAHA